MQRKPSGTSPEHATRTCVQYVCTKSKKQGVVLSQQGMFAEGVIRDNLVSTMSFVILTTVLIRGGD